MWLFFSVLGVHLFSGCLGACSDPAKDQADCVGSYRVDGRAMERVWSVPFYNFDDVSQSFLTLFAMSSLDGWHVTMYRGNRPRNFQPPKSSLRPNLRLGP